MLQNRYQIYVQDDFSFKLIQSCCSWQQAVVCASLEQVDSTSKVYIFDTKAINNTGDVYRIDVSGKPVATGHLARSFYEQVTLTPIASLVLMGVTEPLACSDAVMVMKPLIEVGDDTQALSGDSCLLTTSVKSAVLESPFARQHQQENDVAVMVYCNDALIAMAVFSRYIEDHRFPAHQSELCYELSLHTVFVAEEYRGMGIATSLANTIVNIARKDMMKLHQRLTEANICLKPWFSALALTAGGEAICDILSEAFVEMNDDVIEELMDDGLALSYQDPVICVESLA